MIWRCARGWPGWEPAGTTSFYVWHLAQLHGTKLEVIENRPTKPASLRPASQCLRGTETDFVRQNSGLHLSLGPHLEHGACFENSGMTGPSTPSKSNHDKSIWGILALCERRPGGSCISPRQLRPRIVEGWHAAESIHEKEERWSLALSAPNELQRAAAGQKRDIKRSKRHAVVIETATFASSARDTRTSLAGA